MKPESQERQVLPRAVDGAGNLSTAPRPAAQIVPVTRPGMPSSTAAVAITPMSLLRALRRRAILALGVAILAAGIAGPAAWSLVTVAFKAQAKLQIAAQPPKILFQTLETQDLGGDAYKRYQSTQQTLVKSQLVLNAALSNPEVSKYSMIREQSDPVTWLQAKLSVEFIAGSEVMEISLNGRDPVEVAGIVNAVTTAYMDEVANVDAKHRTGRYENLVKIKERYQENLKQRREIMRKLAETVGSNDRDTLALRQQYAMEHLEHLQKELLEIESQKRRVEARVKVRAHPEERASDESSAPKYSSADVDKLVDQHPSVASLLEKLDAQVERLNSEMVRVQRVARNPVSEPLLHALRNDINATRRLLARRRAEVRPVALRQLQQGGTEEQVVQVDEDQRELAMLGDLEGRLKSEIDSIKVTNHSLTVNTLDLQSIKDDVTQLEAAATKVATEVEALSVELSAPPRIRPIDDAVVPRTRDDKKRFMTVGMVTFGSFFAGLLGIAFLELLSRKVDSVEEVPSDLGLSVVGALPILPPRTHHPEVIAQRQTEKDRYWRNRLLESIDATRTVMVHAAQTRSHRVVMISSAVAGEGKTSLASYLATSLARSGLRTLLVDADLRSPSIHHLFDLPKSPGLSELARGEIDLDGVIRCTPIEDLDVLPAGCCDRQTLRLLAQGGLGPLFDRLKERFDFVIVDSSPVLPVADTLLIAQGVDAVLFSIMQEVSSKTKVSAAIQRLESLDVHLLGAVVTGTTGGLYGTSYYGPDSTYPGLPESVAEPSTPS
jgi:polysaccharide biosynthesis transport protein